MVITIFQDCYHLTQILPRQIQYNCESHVQRFASIDNNAILDQGWQSIQRFKASAIEQLESSDCGVAIAAEKRW